MSILLLSLLFAVLLVVGVYLQPRRIEMFTAKNVLSMPDMTLSEKKSTIDALSRDKVLQNATSNEEKSVKRKMKCNKKKCPVCPDMSKYIRLDEVPCWNCSLP